MSELARKSKITRSLIYYYFGRTKVSILTHAVLLFGNEFSGQTPARIKLWEEGDFAAGVLRSRSILESVPALLPFYFLNRSRDHEIGMLLRQQELEFKKKITVFHPSLSKTEKNALFSFYFGVVFAPDISEMAIRVAASQLNWLKQNN